MMSLVDHLANRAYEPFDLFYTDYQRRSGLNNHKIIAAHLR
jgi:hypothetical protein